MTRDEVQAIQYIRIAGQLAANSQQTIERIRASGLSPDERTAAEAAVERDHLKISIELERQYGRCTKLSERCLEACERLAASAPLPPPDQTKH